MNFGFGTLLCDANPRRFFALSAILRLKLADEGAGLGCLCSSMGIWGRGLELLLDVTKQCPYIS